MMRWAFFGWLLWVHCACAGDVWGIPVTEGAAPGYVPDDTCSNCHDKIAHSFAGHGMARSFYAPSADKVIEDFGTGFHHIPSDRHYQMSLREGDYWFRRWRKAPDGTELDVFETRVDWIVGSGNHSRVYLFRSPNGELTQLPLAWYTQMSGWAMAPGFETQEQLGLQRIVPKRCMACHTAYPNVPEGADAHGLPAIFPDDIPQGIGCQRCHGPGADHVEAAIDAELAGGDEAAIAPAIVNPADLPIERQRDICYSCHFQPSVSVASQLRLGKGSFAFRPGQTLSDHVAHIDIEDALRPMSHRFDINHHPYRLEQSQSFIKSGGQMTCLTCHDPHRKIPQEEQAAHYRAVCMGCHEEEKVSKSHPALTREQGCTDCHMPKRRPQDVIEVWMTDHKIQIPQDGDTPLVRIEKVPADVVGVKLIKQPDNLRTGEGVIYQTMAILDYTAGKASDASDALARVLSAQRPPYFAPWLDLAEALMVQGQFDSAMQAAQVAANLAPDHPGPLKIAGLTQVALGDFEAALELTQRSIELSPKDVTQFTNLATIYRHLGDAENAIQAAQAAIALRPTNWAAWRLIGELSSEAGALEDAVLAFEAALAAEPMAGRVRPALIETLIKLGRNQEAARHRALLVP